MLGDLRVESLKYWHDSHYRQGFTISVEKDIEKIIITSFQLVGRFSGGWLVK